MDLSCEFPDTPEQRLIREEVKQMNKDYQNSIDAWAESHNEIPT